MLLSYILEKRSKPLSESTECTRPSFVFSCSSPFVCIYYTRKRKNCQEFFSPHPILRFDTFVVPLPSQLPLLPLQWSSSLGHPFLEESRRFHRCSRPLYNIRSLSSYLLLL